MRDQNAFRMYIFFFIKCNIVYSEEILILIAYCGESKNILEFFCLYDYKSQHSLRLILFPNYIQLQGGSNNFNKFELIILIVRKFERYCVISLTTVFWNLVIMINYVTIIFSNFLILENFKFFRYFVISWFR